MTEETKNINGYTKIPHSIWGSEMTKDERYMYWFLLDRENLFNKENDWFSLTDDDFIEEANFGRDKVSLRNTRNKLIEREYISFKRVAGKKSLYKILKRF